MFRTIILAVVVACGIAKPSSARVAADCVHLGQESAEDHGPAYAPGDRFKDLVENGVEGYKEQHWDYLAFLESPYTSHGRYFAYNVTKNFNNHPDRVIFDSDGIPLVHYDPLPGANYAGGYEYNPVTIAQFGLMEHARYRAGDQSALALTLTAARKLIAMQGPDGGFRFPFPYKHFQNTNPYLPGWTSALAQGQALSLFARAYDVSGDPEFVRAGDEAFGFLLRSVDHGGTRDTLSSLDPSLSRYVMFEEYPMIPPDTKPNYTVNGFMHVLIGLYDWSSVQVSQNHQQAGEYFSCGAASLKKIVPYADIGGFTAYDLGQVIWGRKPLVNPAYHAIHIYMLFTMFDLTKDIFFERWALKWAADVDPNLSIFLDKFATQ